MIWIATEYGLNRMDGLSIESYFTDHGLVHNKLNTLFVDSKNRIWVGTDAGVSVIENNRIDTSFTPDMIDESVIISIYEDSEGNFWFGTDGEGVWLYDFQKNWSHYSRVNGLANNRVRSITEDREGVLWFGTRNGLTSLDEGNFRTFTTRDGLVDNKIRELYIDDYSNIWISTRGGISVFNNGEFKNLTESNGLVNNRVRSIKKGPFGEMVIGTEEGLSILRDGEFINYVAEHGLTNRYVVKVFSDDQHGIWLGTFGGGVNYLPPFNIRNYTINEGLPNNMISGITAIQDNEVVVSSYGGGIIFIKDGRVIKTFNEDDGLVNNKVYTVYPDTKGRLLIGTRWGLSIYENGTFTNYDENLLPERKIRAIHQSDERTYWLGTMGDGLIKMENGEFKTYTKENGLSNNTVRDIVQDSDGVLWIATYGGVNTFANNEFTDIINTEDGLPNNGINDIEIDHNGDLWFATYNGFVHYNGQDMVTYGVEQGLIDEVCYFIKEEKKGLFWIGTNQGIVRFNHHALNRSGGENDIDTTSAFRSYTVDQGIISNEFNTQAVFIDRNNHLWAGTVGGLTRLELNEPDSPPIAPEILISGVDQLGQPIDKDSHFQLSSNKNYLTIEYIGIDFIAPRQVLYEYRLKGTETGWRRTTENVIQYTALSPDTYTFEVRARNFYNTWSQKTGIISFTVLAPFWQRWWFYALSLVLFAGALFFIYRYYSINKAVELERMRVRIASDLHDDIGASLTEIALQTDLLQASGVNGGLKNVLDEIGAQSRQIVTSLEDIVWTIDARNDTLGDLTDRVQDYANQVLCSKDIQVNYNFAHTDMSCEMAVEERENLYLIIKEAINNIAKHSNADTVWIILKYDGEGFLLKIKDNGTKGNGVIKKSGHGLRNMKMRSQKLDAELNIKNADGFSIEVLKN